MPLRKPSPCKVKQCKGVTRETHGYCDKHSHLTWKRIKNIRTQEGEEHHKMYGSVRWRKARQTYLNHRPLCVTCGGIANQVDHIKPHKGDGDLFWDTSNWQPLCQKCHSEKTAKE